MNKNKINIYWFKRDLRLIDNEALYNATTDSYPILLGYFLDSDLVKDKHYSDIHWNFVKQSILDINKNFKKPMVLFVKCHTLIGLQKLNDLYNINAIYSHYESGIDKTYSIDKKVKLFCDSEGIKWFEYSKNGVKRGLNNRKNWIKEWNKYVRSEICNPIINDTKLLDPDLIDLPFNRPSLKTPSSTDIQRGGTELALKYLNSFLDNRISEYTKNISKPYESRVSCSRLSPYISWGNISSRYIWQRAKKAYSTDKNKFQVNSFLSRLRWNSHFIQRFEMEPRIEFESVNRGYKKLKKPINQLFIDAWERGLTGYPLVDASVRCLRQTGYLNFRMISLIVSFFTHHLWQPLQEASHFLARIFLDFEPGIHYSQLQMQAGETGVNTIRIYNPSKNAIERDNNGLFIIKWLPELSKIPIPLIFEPWNMSEMEERLYECKLGKDYPKPIVNIINTRKYASDNLWSMRKDEKVKVERNRILSKHINN